MNEIKTKIPGKCCPECRSTDIGKRKNKTPIWRCYNCYNEFEEPDINPPVNVSNDKPTPRALGKLIEENYSVEEFVEISLYLLSRPMVDPPKILKEYAKMFEDKEKLKSEGISGFDYDKKQAWEILMDQYYGDRR